MSFDSSFLDQAEPIPGVDAGTVGTGAAEAAAVSPPEVQRQNVESDRVRNAHKRIVICADGTWNTPHETSGGQPAATNVWRLYQLIPSLARDGTPQLAYYHRGVGTGGLLDRLLGGIGGWGLSDNILACYRFIIDHYVPGDEIYLFGFSRGAYTARSLAGLLRNSGVIDRAKAGHHLAELIRRAYRLYRGRGDDTSPVANTAVDFRFAHAHPDCRITCIGVWDTVGALGIPFGILRKISQMRYSFHDVTLSSCVDNAFHAIAIDEHRWPFTPTLWDQQLGAQERGQVMEQVWFPGAHADVGGGYAEDRRALATVTLRWMVNRVTQTTHLECDTGRLAQLPSTQLVVHDSMRWWYRLADWFRPPFTRYIDSRLGNTGARDPLARRRESLHRSVDLLEREFRSRPIPDLGHPYHPANVADYQRRRAKEMALAGEGSRSAPSPVSPQRVRPA